MDEHWVIILTDKKDEEYQIFTIPKTTVKKRVLRKVLKYSWVLLKLYLSF